MPTNILRQRKSLTRAAILVPASASRSPRFVLMEAGRIRIRARLADTPTADRLWQALPLHSTAETWGDSMHFEVPIRSGRERNARLNGSIGELYFWAEEQRVIILFGETPISGPSEYRLPRPCNVWAAALEDVTPLKRVAAGEKVLLTAVVG